MTFRHHIPYGSFGAPGGGQQEVPVWTEDANCKGADADIFFPERGASTRKAKAICRACSVQSECLEFAIENSEKFGIWGGLSERERRRIKRQRIEDSEIRDVG